MQQFLRAALVQIYAHAAYNSTTNSLLNEPTGQDIGLSQLSTVASVKSLRKSFFERYISHLTRKIELILDRCIKHEVQLLIFPEYSIPAELLPYLKEKAMEAEICIVAGSHMVTNNSLQYYKESNMNMILEEDGNLNQNFIRQAISPIIHPDGKITHVAKNEASQWETNLIVTDEKWNWTEIQYHEKDGFDLGVKICIDALSETVDSSNQNAKIMVFPSWSPKTDYFDSSAKFYVMHELPVCYVNEATAGGTKVYGWSHRANGNPYLTNEGTVSIPKGEEAILVVDIDLMGQYGKNSTILEHEPLRIKSFIPIVYNDQTEFSQFIKSIDGSFINLNDHEYEIIPKIGGVSQILRNKISYLNDLIESGIARKEDREFNTELIFDALLEPLYQIQYEALKNSQKVILPIFQTSLIDKAMDVMQNVRSEIKTLEKLYPWLEKGSHSTGEHEVEKNSPITRPYLGREEAIGYFRRFVNDVSVKVCGIFGMRGIGKTEFLREGINQVLPSSWVRISVLITQGTGFNRFIMTIMDHLRIPYKEDNVNSMVIGETEDLLKVIFEKFDSLPSTCLLIDDWHNVMARRGYRDKRFLRFLQIATTRNTTSNNKIIFASQVKVELHGLHKITLKSLDENAIRGIIDWNIRTSRSGTAPVLIPDELIVRLFGNPLAATLASQLIDKFPVEAILENTQVQQQFQNRLIVLLLDQIDLSEDERKLADYISIYNVPVEFSAIESFAGERTVELIESLTDYFLLNFNPQTGLYQMHPLIRDHYLRNIEFAIKTEYHKIAAEYYSSKLKLSSNSPIDKGEHVSHLAHSLQFKKVDQYRTVYAEELRPVALRLFKERRIKEALHYYQILDTLYHDDIDIKFHIGLCYAHLEQWAKAELAIHNTIQLDNKAWWVLSGYADILTRKRQLAPAEKYLHQALEILEKTDTPKWKYSAVYQSLALVFDNSGNTMAEHYYKLAIDYHRESAFARYAYAKFLYYQGDIPAALEQLGLAESYDSSLKQVHLLKEKILSNPDIELIEEEIEEKVVEPI